MIKIVKFHFFLGLISTCHFLTKHVLNMVSSAYLKSSIPFRFFVWLSNSLRSFIMNSSRISLSSILIAKQESLLTPNRSQQFFLVGHYD